MRVRVKSGRMGYYGLMRRREGTEFEIEKPEDFSDKWMEAVDGPAPARSEGDAKLSKTSKAPKAEKSAAV